MCRVMHFEIQADDVERAIKFYMEVFGWNFEQWEKNDYWMVYTAKKGSTEPGINGGLLKREQPLAKAVSGANAYVCTMVVEDFDAISKKISEAGGNVVTPKYALVGMAWQGYFSDTEGNTFGVHQPDEQAK